MNHRWVVTALFAVVVAISCETRPELTRAHAADEIREWICSQEADLCPDSISTDLLRIRMEGNDLRHVDINGEHYVTYYWSDEGWALTAAEALNEWIQNYRTSERLAGTNPEQRAVSAMKSDLRNLAAAEEAYFADNQTYTSDIAALDLNISQRVTVRIHSADGKGWGATATHSGVAQTCALFYGAQYHRPSPAEQEAVVKCS